MGKGSGDVGPILAYYGQLVKFFVLITVCCGICCSLPVFGAAVLYAVVLMLSNFLHKTPPSFPVWNGAVDQFHLISLIMTTVAFMVSTFVSNYRADQAAAAAATASGFGA